MPPVVGASGCSPAAGDGHDFTVTANEDLGISSSVLKSIGINMILKGNQ